MKLRAAADAGFSLVELVAILVVIGILAAFAAPRFADRTGFESRGFYDQAQGLVRYAQKIAIAQRQSAPKGNGHALLCARQFFGDEPFAVVIMSEGVKMTEADQVFPELARLIWEFEAREAVEN